MNTWIDLLNNKKYSLPDSIEGKPVSFYINNSKVAAIAKSFFKGEFRPTDNDSTTELLSYVTTDDSTIRPFYRWCLDFTISISDGALGEYPGDPALKYAIKFPEEFFNYMDKDSSGNRYKEWTEIIAYSGLNEYNENQTLIEKTIKTRMRDNCHKCGEGTKNRIATFVKHLTETVKLQN